jgi:small subunit ribosomal protein S9
LFVHYDVKVTVKGGELRGQVDATVFSISRILASHNEALCSIFRKDGLFTVDSRLKERNKYGLRDVWRRFQFVKR